MSTGQSHFYDFGPFTVDESARLLLRDGQAVPLELKVFQTLLVLVQNQGKLLSKKELMHAVWGDETFVEEGGLARNISQLRSKLAEGLNGEQCIETFPKRGYRFTLPVTERLAPDPQSSLAPHRRLTDQQDGMSEHQEGTAVNLKNGAPITALEMYQDSPSALEIAIDDHVDKDSNLEYLGTAAPPTDVIEIKARLSTPQHWASTAAKRVVTVCPYRGLRPFRDQDAQFFAGRKGVASHLLEVTAARKLVAVIGASGSGKSSVVQAGLIPLLRQRSPHEIWQCLSFTPGSRPFHRLAAAIMPFLEPKLTETDRLREAQKLAQHLATRELRLFTVWDQILTKSTDFDRFLLIADQFEELFALTPEEERELFVETVLESVGMDRVTLLLTLRADFYAHAVSLNRQLSDQLQNGIVNLGPMTSDELKSAIVEPASRVGLEFERGLAERILDEVADQPGNLPLLEFALTELWNGRRGALLTNDAYERTGRVTGAIATRAEVEFNRHTPSQQLLMRRLFTRLVRVSRPDEGGADVRQRAELNDWDRESQDIARTLAAADTRLLVTGRDESTGTEIVEVAHEALIRKWARLREWLNEDREFLLWRQRLRSALAEYERNGRDSGSLLRGAALAEAERWLLGKSQDLADRERGFIGDSLTLRDRNLREEEQRRKTEIENAERLKEAAERIAATERQRSAEQAETARRFRRLTLGLAVMLALTIAGSGLALWQSEISRVHELIAASQAAEQSDPELSVLIAAQGVATAFRWSRGVLPEAEDQLHRSILGSHLKLTLSGHHDAVWGVAWSPDGKRLATASADHTAKIWNAQTGRELLTLVGHGAAVTKIAWGADGERIATSSEDGTAKIWDAETGGELMTLRGHGKAVDDIVWSPDGKRLATASADRTAGVWDAGNGAELMTLRGHGSAVISVAWSANGKWLATGSEDSTAKVWDAQTGKEVRTLHGHRFGIDSVAWSPDGTRIATGSWDSTAKVWNAETGGEALTLSGHQEPVVSVAWSPDAKRLATGSADSTTKVWDAETGKELLTLRGHGSSVLSVAWDPNNNQLATASADSTAKVWDVETNREVLSLRGHSRDVMAVAWSPDGNSLATGSFDGTAKLWDVKTGRDRLTLQGHSDRVDAVAWSLDGKLLATGAWDRSARLWDAGTGKELLVLGGHTGVVNSVVWSPEGARLATASGDSTARVWDVKTGKELMVLRGHGGPVNSVAWSPDGARLATGSWDKVVKLWDTKTGNELLALRGHTDFVYCVAWAPDGKRLATGSEDKTAKVWDAETGKELLTLAGHTGSVTSLAWSPDGKLLATGSEDNTAKVWDSRAGTEMLTLRGHNDHIWSVAWSPDGKQLATGSGDRTVQIFAMEIHDLMALARKRVTAHPSAVGCKRFLRADGCPPFPELTFW